MRKLFLITICLFLSGCATPQLGRTVELREFTKINIVGEGYFHTFENRDGRFVQEITKEEYEDFALRSIIPVLEGAKHINAFKGSKFNTVSGRPEANQYYEDGTEAYIKLAEDRSIIRIEKESIQRNGDKDNIDINDLQRVD